MRSIRPSVRARMALAGLLLASPVLAACSGDDSSADNEPSEAPASEATEAVPTSSTLEGRTPVNGDLTIDACPSGEGELEAAGKIRNRSRDTADFVITVTWLDDNGSVITSAEGTVEDVARRKGADWTVAATVDETASSCTTVAARGTLP